MCNLFTEVQICWGSLEQSQGPSSAPEYWWLLLGMFTFSVNSPVEESWTKLLWTFENLFYWLLPVDQDSLWGAEVVEEESVTTGQASHTSDVIAPACAGTHICVLWNSVRISFPALDVPIRCPGSPWVSTSVPERWCRSNSPACEGVILRQNSLLVNSVHSLTSSLVECL